MRVGARSPLVRTYAVVAGSILYWAKHTASSSVRLCCAALVVYRVYASFVYLCFYVCVFMRMEVLVWRP